MIESEHGAKRKRWFSLTVLIEGLSESISKHGGRFEEVVILVQAATEQEAQDWFERKRREPPHRYESATGDEVRWIPRDLVHFEELLDEELSSGVEVRSLFLSSDEADQLRRIYTSKLEL